MKDKYKEKISCVGSSIECGTKIPVDSCQLSRKSFAEVPQHTESQHQLYPTVSETVKLIIFFACWCGPSKMLDPIIEDLKKKFGNKVEFKKVDVDDNQELACKYTIHQVPTLIIEKNGVVIKRYNGLVFRGNILEEDINSALRANEKK
jgi:thioredoxin 1